MGFFDKFSDSAKKLGQKLSSGIQKLGDKISENISEDLKPMTVDEVFNTLLDDKAGKIQWKRAYEDAKDLDLASAKKGYWYLVEALGIWRKVKADADFNPSLARSMAYATYDFFLDSLDDDVIDMIYRIDDEVPDLMKEVFEQISDFEEKDYYDALQLVACYMDGMGTKKDYRMTYACLNFAYALNDQQEDEELKQAREVALNKLCNHCDKKLENFEAFYDQLFDDEAGEELWEIAADEMSGMAGFSNLNYAASVMCFLRGVWEEGDEEGTIEEAIEDSVYLAWYHGEPFCERLMNMHSRMAEFAPHVYLDVVEKHEDSDNPEYSVLASAYLFGWGVEQDCDKAREYVKLMIERAEGEDGDKGDLQAADHIIEYMEEME